jgi:guanylate kinase
MPRTLIDTTRAPRAGEQDGREYYFTTKDDFLDLVNKNGFIEHAEFSGNYYGTSVKAVKDIAEKEKICILDIEMEVRVERTRNAPVRVCHELGSQNAVSRVSSKSNGPI